MEKTEAVRQLVMAKLSPMERENVYEFLIGNQVEFIPNPQNGTFVAKVHVLQKVEPKEEDGHGRKTVHHHHHHHHGGTGLQAGREPGPAESPAVGYTPQGAFSQLATPRSMPFSSPRTGTGSTPASPRGGQVGSPRKALPFSAAAARRGRGVNLAVPGVQSARAAQVLSASTELNRRYRHFCGLLPQLSKLPKAMQRAEFFRIVEDLYAARFAQEALQLRAEAAALEAGTSPPSAVPYRGFPSFVLTFMEKRYGLKQVVSRCCWSLVNSAHQLRGLYVGADLFARFLEETLDDLDLLFLLNTRCCVRQVMLTDKRRAVNCAQWQRVWNASYLPVELQPFATELSTSAAPPGAGGGASPREAAGATPCERLDTKQVLQVIREAVSKKELKETVMTRLNKEMGGDHVRLDGQGGGSIDVDRFLYITTEEFHADRGDQRHSELDPRLQELIEVLKYEYGENLEDAFLAMDTKRRGMLTYSEFVRALKSTRFDGDAHDVWEMIDRDGDGAITKEDFLAMSSINHEDANRAAAPDHGEGFRWSNWNPDMDPLVLQEARTLEQRLLAALAERGEAGRARPAEVRGWAVNVALGRRGARSQQRRSGKEPAYTISPEEMQQAWWAFSAEDQRPALSHLDDVLTREDNVEATVRQLLAQSIEDLVSDALSAALEECQVTVAAGETFMREALLCEFAPMGDALVEALVSGNSQAWLQELGVEGAGSDAQRRYFQDCRRTLQAMLSSTISTGAVHQLCFRVAATPELRDAARTRAQQLAEGPAGGGKSIEHPVVARVGPAPRSAGSVLKHGSWMLESLAEVSPVGEQPEPDAELSQELPHGPMELILEEQELPAGPIELISLDEKSGPADGEAEAEEVKGEDATTGEPKKAEGVPATTAEVKGEDATTGEPKKAEGVPATTPEVKGEDATTGEPKKAEGVPATIPEVQGEDVTTAEPKKAEGVPATIVEVNGEDATIGEPKKAEGVPATTPEAKTGEPTSEEAVVSEAEVAEKIAGAPAAGEEAGAAAETKGGEAETKEEAKAEAGAAAETKRGEAETKEEAKAEAGAAAETKAKEAETKEEAKAEAGAAAETKGGEAETKEEAKAEAGAAAETKGGEAETKEEAKAEADAAAETKGGEGETKEEAKAEDAKEAEKSEKAAKETGEDPHDAKEAEESEEAVKATPKDDATTGTFNDLDAF